MSVLLTDLTDLFQVLTISLFVLGSQGSRISQIRWLSTTPSIILLWAYLRYIYIGKYHPWCKLDHIIRIKSERRLRERVEVK